MVRYNQAQRKNGITPTKSSSFCMTTFSASLTNVTVFQPQLHERSYFVSRKILVLPSLRLHKYTDLRAHDFAQSPTLVTSA
jgi:hypothetical protein